MSRDCQEVLDGKKKCSSCGEYKEVHLFRVQSAAKSGRKSKCKLCCNASDRKYTSVEKNRANAAKWRKDNKERLKQYNKDFLTDTTNKERSLQRNKITANARYRMYTVQEYTLSFISLFEAGMSFDNHGKWEIDHIIPVTAWLDSGVTDLDIINSIDNLQPLWKKDNMNKSNKIMAEC